MDEWFLCSLHTYVPMTWTSSKKFVQPKILNLALEAPKENKICISLPQRNANKLLIK